LFIVSRYDYLDRTIFSSFDYRCLNRVRELAPEARIGIIFDAATKADPLEAAKELAAGSVHIHKDLASRELERAQRGRTFVWTVNEARYGKLCLERKDVSDSPEKFWKLKWKSS
jgi:glycerophosphoryl diester phosphodiesterase